MDDAYFTGEKFSTTHRFVLPLPQPLVDRFSALEMLFSGKHVIDVGCADHPEVVAEKLAHDEWLHGRLARVAKRCLGFDVNAAAVQKLRESRWNIHAFDVTKGVHEAAAGVAEKLVVTVPNALRVQNGLNARHGCEIINSDHRFWFTPFTISKVLSRGGFRRPFVRCVTAGPLEGGGLRALLRRRTLEKYPLLRDILLVEAEW